MSDDHETHGAAAGDASEASKGWGELDNRMLVIATVGGLAANVGVVILVGLAVAFLRWYAPKGSDALAVVLPFALVAICSIFLICIGNSIRRNRAPRFLGVEMRWFGWLALGAGSLFALEVVLVLTGWAAGVAK
jgi:hypothetical protein